MYEQTLERFSERYPHLAFPALSWEPIEPPQQPIEPWVRKLQIEKVEVLYIYGMDDGAAYRALKPWLSENPKRRIVFLIDHSGYVATLIHQGAPLLEDPQVEIAVDFSIDELAEKFPMDQVEVVALPGRSNRQFRTLRGTLLEKAALARSFYMEKIYGHLITKRFVRNFPRVQEAFYANRLKNAFEGVPAIICGAGPSLENDLPLLKQLDSRAILIAGGSAVGALTLRGIEPHFAIAVDPNLEEFKRFRNSFYFEGPFIFSTRLCPQVFSTCNGPFGYLRSGVGSIPELWLEEELKLDDEPLLAADLDQNTIAVTPLALAFAHLLGCNPIILSGVDLAYTQGRRYASSVDFEESLKELKHEKNATNQILTRKDKQGNWVTTAVRWEMERQSLASFARKHPKTTWVNATQGGLRIHRFAEKPLAEVLAPFHQQPNLKERIQREIEKHPMPSMEGLLDRLKESLFRAIDCLEILAGEKEGSAALAEIDLMEEIATAVFLVDLPKACRQHFGTETPPSQERWKFYLKIARNHASVF